VPTPVPYSCRARVVLVSGEADTGAKAAGDRSVSSWGMSLGEGSVLGGRYRLVSQIGRGGMGTVWHAHDELLDREVGVKAMLVAPELTPDEYEVLHRRTLREARLAARLNHPAIVTIHDVVEEDGRPWIVMELLHARSLDEQVKQDGPLEPRRVA